MKEIKKPSVIPVYGFAAVWLLYCLIFPMTGIWHILICAAVSVLAFFLLKKKYPGTVEYIEETVSTGDKELDELLAGQTPALERLEAIRRCITSPAIEKKVSELQELTRKIYEDVRKDPSDLRPARRFLDYYQPTTETLLSRYVELQSNDIGSENMTSAKMRIEEILDGILTAYRKELNSLYENDLVDITADIQVMKQKMAAEGLTEHQEI